MLRRERRLNACRLRALRWPVAATDKLRVVLLVQNVVLRCKPSAGGTVGGAKMTVVGRQIINTGGPARMRYRAIRAAVITLIILVCIAILVFFVRGRRAHPLTPAYGHHARTTSGARPAGATNP